MDNIENFNDYSKRITEKFKDKDVYKKYNEALLYLKEIHEYPIIVSIMVDDDPDNLEIIETYRINEIVEGVKNLKYLDNEFLTLRDVMETLDTEENIDKKVLIATKHLKPESLNPISGFMVLGMDDNIIVVPKNDEIDEKN